MQNTYDHSAFGETYAPGTSVTVDQRYAYTGREKNAASGTMYYRYRTYEQGLGRFVGRDPIGYGGGVNIYAYVENSPILYADAFGLKLSIGDDDNYKKDVGVFIKKLCSKASVDGAGNVSVADGPYDKSEKEACCCLKELAGNSKNNKIEPPAPGVGPHAVPGKLGDEQLKPLPPGEHGPLAPGPGTEGTVKFNPETKLQDREKKSDPWRDIPNEIGLGHELCGHVLRFNRGTQVPPGRPSKPGETPPHEKVPVEVEDKLREEKGIHKRPTFGNPDLVNVVP